VKWGLIAILIVVIDAFVGYVIVRALMHNTFDALVRRFPAHDPAPDAVHRRFQQFRMGLVNFVANVAVDGERLHLRPPRIVALLGARPASIPWSAMRIRKRSRSGRRITVDLERGLSVEGPAWCLALVEPPAAGTPDAS
jgi:hypothetical protein